MVDENFSTANDDEKGKRPTPRWFEKTVEYKFIADAIRKYAFSFAFPLDGDAERIGDTVFFKNSTFIIVEFKKALEDLSAEYRKYKCLDESKESDKENFVRVIKEIKDFLKTEGQDVDAGHHFLVGGQAERNEAGQYFLGLENRRIFFRGQSGKQGSLENCWVG